MRELFWDRWAFQDWLNRTIYAAKFSILYTYKKKTNKTNKQKNDFAATTTHYNSVIQAYTARDHISFNWNLEWLLADKIFI